MIGLGFLKYIPIVTCTNAVMDSTHASSDIYLTGDGVAGFFTRGSHTYGTGLCTKGKSSGKWYTEFVVGTLTVSGWDLAFGVGTISTPLIDNYPGQTSDSWAVRGIPAGYNHNGFVFGGTTNYPGFYYQGAVCGVGLDMDNGAFYFSIDGTWINGGVPTSGASKTGAIGTGLTGTYYMIYGVDNPTDVTWKMQNGCPTNPFTYSPPAGYSAY